MAFGSIYRVTIMDIDLKETDKICFISFGRICK